MRLINCSWNEFENRVGNRRIYCFGGGAVSDIFLDLIAEVGKYNNIDAFVDNDEKKIGTEKHYMEGEIRIISVSELCGVVGKGLIVITCSDVAGVVDQLEKIEMLDNVECYSMHMMLSKHEQFEEMASKIKDTELPLIPKVIHYCWFGKTKIPERNQQLINDWKIKCPDYEIIEWNESNYDYKKNSYMYQAYEMKKWGFVPDYARLDIIYNEGGIYLDTDVEIVKNIDELRYNRAFAGRDSSRHVNLGSGFGAVKYHEMIREMRDYYDHVLFCDESNKCNLAPCLVHQHTVFRKYQLSLNDSYQIINSMAIYPNSILNGIDCYSHKYYLSQDTFFCHHGDASWLPPSLADARDKRINFINYMNEGNQIEGKYNNGSVEQCRNN